MKRVLLLAILALPSLAQVLTDTPRGVVVAHDRRIELVKGWSVAGVEHATAIVASAERVAVLDALNNEAVLVDLATGKAQRVRTAETPIAAIFVKREVYILARDARVLQRVGGETIPLDADPSHVAVSNGRIYVYSRAAGVLREIGGARYAVPPFASDFEVKGESFYLVYPREGKVRVGVIPRVIPSEVEGPPTGASPRVIPSEVEGPPTGASPRVIPSEVEGPPPSHHAGNPSLKMTDIPVGAVPVDLAFAGGGTALTARILAVADPSAKRVWLTESTQSMTAAVARGLLRGVLGLGLFGGRASQFPTGVDRVETRGKVWIAYDSSSRTLVHFTRKQSAVLARGVAPHAFALTANGVAWWDGTSVAEKRLR